MTVKNGSATNIGTYTATVTPASGYAWNASGDRSAKTVTWKISALSIASSSVKVSGVSSAYTCTGKTITPLPKITYGSKILTRYVDYTVSYSSNIWAGKATITIKGKGNYSGSRSVSFTIKAKNPTVAYQSYMQGSKWQAWKTNGATSGLAGKSKRVEALKIKLTSQSYSGSIRVNAYVQGKGWQGYKNANVTAGLTGKSKRVEALRISLTGDMAKKYDVYYRVYVQKKGWTGWAKNGANCGSQGYSYRMEAFQVKLVAKGGKAPGKTSKTFYKK